MNRRALALCVIGSILLGLNRAEPSDEKDIVPELPAGRYDQYGDPLPDFAIARIGTIRWRVAGAVGLSFSPDGKRLASAANDATVRLWEVPSGQESRRLTAHDARATSVVFSPDGKTVASAGDGAIHLSDAATGKLLRTFKRVDNTKRVSLILSVAFAPDGQTLAAGEDRALRLWEVSSGKELMTVQHKGEVCSVAVTPDGKSVVAAHRNDGVWQWAVPSGQEVRRFRPDQQQPRESFTGVAISPDGTLLAGSGDHGRGRTNSIVWDLATGKQVHCFQHPDVEMRNPVFTSDGKHLAVSRSFRRKAGSPADIVFLDLQTGQEAKRYTEPNRHVYSLAIAPNGRLLAAGMGGTIRLWDLVANKELAHQPAHNNEIARLAVSPDGKTVCTYGYDGTVRSWDARTGQHRHLFARLDHYPRAVAFANGGKQVVAAASRTYIWDAESGKELNRFDIGDGGRFGALSADGQLLAMRASDRGEPGVILWQITTGKQTGSIGNEHASETVFSPDSKRLAVHHQGVVQVWETATGRLSLEVPFSSNKEGDDIHLGAFTADGGKLLIHEKGTLFLLDIATGKKGRQIAVDEDDAHTIAVSPDGKWLAAAERVGPVRLFNLDSNKTVRLVGHQEEASELVFSSDGKTLFSAGDTTVLVWDLTAIPAAEFERISGGYLWWAIAAGVLLLALAALWKLCAFFGRWFRSA